MFRAQTIIPLSLTICWGRAHRGWRLAFGYSTTLFLRPTVVFGLTADVFVDSWSELQEDFDVLVFMLAPNQDAKLMKSTLDVCIPMRTALPMNCWHFLGRKPEVRLIDQGRFRRFRD
jgi:hypothetical protein